MERSFQPFSKKGCPKISSPIHHTPCDYCGLLRAPERLKSFLSAEKNPAVYGLKGF
ncbi:MAG: hypothetical protein QXS05_00220 [Candidatus Bathyarchaeia archaeon]